jgi:hypothetical protein
VFGDPRQPRADDRRHQDAVTQRLNSTRRAVEIDLRPVIDEPDVVGSVGPLGKCPRGHCCVIHEDRIGQWPEDGLNAPGLVNGDVLEVTGQQFAVHSVASADEGRRELSSTVLELIGLSRGNRPTQPQGLSLVAVLIALIAEVRLQSIHVSAIRHGTVPRGGQFTGLGAHVAPARERLLQVRGSRRSLLPIAARSSCALALGDQLVTARRDRCVPRPTSIHCRLLICGSWARPPLRVPRARACNPGSCTTPGRRVLRSKRTPTSRGVRAGTLCGWTASPERA